MSEHDYTVIDGSQGEGGGQIVRTALALAMLTGRPLKLVNIRGGRKKPGLRPQHLTAVQASTKMCGADIRGARLGAREFTFRPGKVRAGTYNFNIGTAGAATLVLQTLLPPLSRVGEESALVVSGGTHVPWSPPYHYFNEVFLPAIRWLGCKCDAIIRRWGWYPRGGGEIEIRITPTDLTASVPLDRPFELARVTGISASSRLPEHIRVRQRKQLLARLRHAGFEAEIDALEVSAVDQGSLVFICAQGKHSLAGFSSLGKRGKPAERVADETADDLFRFLDSGAAFDPHLADQVLLYLAQSPGVHQFTTSTITKHLLSNARVIERFLPVRFEVVGSLNESGLVIKRDK